MRYVCLLVLLLGVRSVLSAPVPFFTEDFGDDALASWEAVDVGRESAPSAWSANAGAVHQTSNIYTRLWNGDRTADWTGTYLVRRGVEFRDGVVETAFWSTDDDGVGLAWRYADPGNLCKLQINSAPPFWQLSRSVNGEFRCVAVGETGYRVGRVHRLRVRCEGTRTAVWLDDTLLYAGDIDGPRSGCVALESRGNQGTHVDYVRAMAAEPWTAGEFGRLVESRVLMRSRLANLAVLPGGVLRLELPAATTARAVVRAGGRVLAEVPLDRETVDLWTNPGGMDALGEVSLEQDGAPVRVLPFNTWERFPAGIGACAHRGDSEVAPENTLPAIRSAVVKGAQQIEIDVTRTRDGHLVLLHDDTLDRTTDGTGKPGDHDLAEIRKLDAGSWKAPEWKGTRIPTLEEALAEIPAGTWVNLHLKTGVAVQAAELLTRLKRTERCFLACSADDARRVREVNPAIRVCNMTNQRGADSPYPAETIALGADFLQFYDGNLPDSLPAVCRELREHGVRINYFPANDPGLFRRLLEAGVDFPLTDRLDAMHGVLAELGLRDAGETVPRVPGR